MNIKKLCRGVIYKRGGVSCICRCLHELGILCAMWLYFVVSVSLGIHITGGLLSREGCGCRDGIILEIGGMKMRLDVVSLFCYGECSEVCEVELNILRMANIQTVICE